MKRVCKINQTVLAMMTLAAVAIAFKAPAASAQGISPVVWSASPVSFDNGQAPSVAISGLVAVEVHEGDSGTLWYSVGQIQGSSIVWTVPVQYANGYAPSIAISGNTVIEVHQGGSGFGPLWNVCAQISSSFGISWGSATQYDNGLAPSVAADGLTVVEVHQGGSGVGPLWYHTGELLAPVVEWSSSASQYDTGVAPSVAVAGSTVIEVHQIGTGEGPLWYHAAEARANGSVVWATTGFQYSSGGIAPSVSASGPTVIEVHQVVSGVGRLWYYTAGLQSSGTVKFAAKPFKYDSGETPRVAVAGATIVEVHDSNSGVGPIFYHTAAY
jgi:hypothetical protein